MDNYCLHHRSSLVMLYLLLQKVKKVKVACFTSYSAVFAILWHIISLGHWATLGNQRSGLHGETILLSVFCVQPTHGAQEYLTCTDGVVLGYQFTPWSSLASGIHFLCPEKFTLGQCRIRTTDLSICSRTCYLQTNAPRNPS